MSFIFLGKTFPVARKQHICIWCGQTIEVGEKYERSSSIYDNSFQDQKSHLECADDMQKEADADGGFLEFNRYENERPEREVSQ